MSLAQDRLFFKEINEWFYVCICFISERHSETLMAHFSDRTDWYEILFKEQRSSAVF
jgi:hypothetical protein